MNPWEGDDRRSPERWKLKKEISVADLLSFIAAALAVIYAYTTLDKRLTVIEIAEVQARSTNAQQDETILRMQARIDAQLDRLNDKVDKLLQRYQK